MSAMYTCGCAVIGFELRHCAMHHAAPLLLEACEAALVLLRAEWPKMGALLEWEPDSVRELKAKLTAAIDAARGKS